MRATSTVLDVALCLLFVTASVVTLVGAPSEREPSRDTAETTAGVVATSTANVTYALGDERRPRTVHDTLAGLLATAAVTNATVEGHQRGLFPHSGGFRRAVARTVAASLRRTAIRGATGRDDLRAQVVARWEPYWGSALRGRVTAGAK
ncbi:hypothetical protein ACFO3H_06315, partial [Halorussus sp. GCM10023401]